MMNPRNRYYHVLLLGHTCLLLFSVALLWTSNRRATTSTRRALAGFDRRLAAVSNLVFSSTSGSSSEKLRREPVAAPASSIASSGVSDWRLVPPRVLGSGRSRAWCYVDVRYGDGATCRHFVRTNATPREVKSFVRDLALQAESHSWVSDSLYTPEKKCLTNTTPLY